MQVTKNRISWYYIPERRGDAMADSKLPRVDWESTGIKVMEEGEKKQVFVGGRPYFSWNGSDESAERLAAVQLCELELGRQEEIAEAFGIHIKSLYNYVNAYKGDGIRGLIDQPKGPKERWKVTPSLKAEILQTLLVEEIKTYDGIQERLEKKGYKVSAESVRGVLIENGFVKERIEIEDHQGDLFEELEEKEDDEQQKFSFPEREAAKRQINKIKESEKQSISEFLESKRPVLKKNRSHYSPAERMYLDLLKRREYSTYAGGLLYIPLLQRYNFLPIIKKVIKIDKENDYTLSQLCLTLFYYNIFGFRSIEHFKTVYPEEFGPLIGKTSSPSIYTIRRFFQDVERLGQGERLIEEFAKWYFKNGLATWGIAYADDHFDPYHGKERISKGFFTTHNKVLKGSYQCFVTDERFNPILFLLRPCSEDFIPRIPEVIRKMRKIAREIGMKEEEIKTLIVIFDRGAYSADLFRILDEGHQELEEEKDKEIKVIFITWAKYADKWVDGLEEKKFTQSTEINYEVQRSEKVKYFEDKRSMNKYGKIRTIVIQSGVGKKRTAIYTNAPQEIPAEKIVRLMCRRWGEEDLIKALKINYLIDYSPGFVTEELEEQPLIENPEVTKLTQTKASLSAKLQRLSAEIGKEIIDSWGKGEIDWAKIKEKKQEVLGEIVTSDIQKFKIQEQIDQLSKKIPYDQAHGGKRLVKFNYERKRFLDCLKVFTYAMDKKMCEILVNYHDRKDVWPTLAMIIRRGGAIELVGNKLYVRLRRFKNPLVDYAARHLCEYLNELKPVTLDKFHFPVHYEVL